MKNMRRKLKSIKVTPKMKRKNKKTINQSNESKEFVLFFSSVYIKTYIDKK